MKILIFCALWLLYGVYYFLVNRLNEPDISILEVACSVPVFALIAHGVYLIIARLLARKRVLIGVLCLLAFYFVVTMLTAWFANITNGWLEVPLDDGAEIHWTDGAFLANMIAMISQYSLYATAFFAMNRAVVNARAKQVEAEGRLLEAEQRLAAERERRRYEFLMLAGQVSPHFMANLLNEWRAQLGDGHRVADAMELTYNLITYHMAAHSPAKRRVPITMEIAQLEAYSELANGHSNQKYIQLRCEGDFEGYTLPPTTLLTFLENAIKHGRSDLPEHPIRMDVTATAGKLTCICHNRIKEQADRHSHGVGLANLRRRLELEYGHRFLLESKQKGSDFIAQLIIHYQ